jgi:protein ImuB
VGAGLASADAPFALIVRQRGALRIAALSCAAARLGLDVGMPLADARAAFPDLLTLPQDTQADRAMLSELLQFCGQYSPNIATDPADTTIPETRRWGLTLDITGCAHLFGGEARMLPQVTQAIFARGLTVAPALAGTPDAARALARFTGGDVHALPLAALNAGEDNHIALRRAGFRRIGDLAPLPRSALAARFGAELVRRLAHLLGEDSAPSDPHRTALPVTAELRFAEPIARTADVLDAAETLLRDAARQLAGRGEGGREFAFALHRSDGHVARLMVATGAPTRDPAWVLRLLRERIDSLADPLDPGFGYDSMDLAVPHCEAQGDQQMQLAGSSTDQQSALGPLLNRLAVRHCDERVLRFIAGASHLPERAAALRPVSASNQHQTLPIPRPTDQPGNPPTRPLFLFDPPQRLEVLAAVSDAPPRRFSWCGQTYRVARAEGPERIAPEWWRRPDGHAGNPGLTRDYYRVEDEHGHRFWLFRHGLYGREADDPAWYLHGLFA